jgi:membrane protease YdiL (CAAX protease family)
LQQLLWAGCVTALAVAGIATWGDRRRAKRTDLDNVGFMPWPLILVLAMIVAAVFAAFAMKAG